MISPPEGTDRPILYNQDIGTLFSETEEPITPPHVDEMVDEVAVGEVDVLLINPNMWRTNYPSDVWETWWKNWEDWKVAHPPLETEGMSKTMHWHHPRHPLRHRMVDQMESLASQGCDYLERALERCRFHDIVPGVSVRMNDQHDQRYPESHYFSDFYRDNPELRLDSDRVSGLAGLDFEKRMVREHFLELIDELAVDYDFEVLELDFLRHPPFFDGRNASSKADVMTRFVSEVRARCTSESIELLARIPGSPPNAVALGLDYESWATEGLVDGLIVGLRNLVGWQMPVGQFRERIGQLPLYVSIEKVADQRVGFPRRLVNTDERLLRGVASAYARTAADGLYFFNYFGTREEPLDPSEPPFRLLAELKRDAALRGQDKIYLTTAGDDTYASRVDPPLQMPIDIKDGLSCSVTLNAMSEPPSQNCSIHVIIDKNPPGHGLWLQLNDQPVGRADRLEEYAQSSYRTENARVAFNAIFRTEAEALFDGKNRITIQNESSLPFTVYGIELHVKTQDD